MEGILEAGWHDASGAFLDFIVCGNFITTLRTLLSNPVEIFFANRIFHARNYMNSPIRSKICEPTVVDIS